MDLSTDPKLKHRSEWSDIVKRPIAVTNGLKQQSQVKVWPWRATLPIQTGVNTSLALK